MSRLEIRTVATSLAILTLALSSTAQDSAVPELDQLRGTFEKDMLEAVTPSARLYLEELQQLERSYAASGRYEEAIATREERLAVATALSSKTVEEPTTVVEEPEASTPAPPTELTRGTLFEASDADISDGANYSASKLLLNDDGATASWDLGTISPGGYEITIGYTSKEDAEIRVQENFFRISTTLPSSEGKPKTMQIGTLKITSLSDNISILRLDDSRLPDGLIIHSIRLLSAKD